MQSNIDIVLSATDKGLKSVFTQAQADVKNMSDGIVASTKDTNKSYAEASKEAEASFSAITEAAAETDNAIEKFNDDQKTSYDKLKEKIIEVADIAVKTADIISATIGAFDIGASVGGVPAGLIAGGVTLAVEIATSLSSANAQAADLDDTFSKIYQSRQQAVILGVTEKGINAEINNLVGDQLTTWSKIRENLPDVAKEILRINSNWNDVFNTSGWSLDNIANDLSAVFDNFSKSLEKPKSDIDALLEDSTQKALRELTIQLVNDRDYIEKHAANQKESHEALLQLYTQYTLQKQQILADSAQKEMEIWQGVMNDLGSTVGANYSESTMDTVISMLKNKYTEILDAQEKSNAVLLNSVEAAHAIRLAKEKEFGDKLAKIAADNIEKSRNAQAEASTPEWVQYQRDTINQAQYQYDKFQGTLLSLTNTGRAKRIEQIKRERDQTVLAYELLGKDTAEVVAAYNEKLSHENIKPAAFTQDNTKQIESVMASLTSKLSLLEGDQYAAKISAINQEFQHMGEVVGFANSKLLEWKDLAISQAGFASINDVMNINGLNDALKKLDSAYAKATLSKEDFSKYEIDQQLEKERIAAMSFGPAAEEYARYAQQVADAEKEMIDQSKAEADAKAEEQKALKETNALRGIYKDLGSDGSQGLFDEEVALLQKRKANYDKFITDKNLTDKWYANEYSKAYKTMILSSDNFFEGINQGYQNMLKNQANLGQLGYTLFEDTFSAAKTTLSSFFDDAWNGKLKSAYSYFHSFAQSILKAWADMLAQMVAKWAMTQAMSGFSSLFGGIFGGGSSAAITGSTSSIATDFTSTILGLADGGKIPGYSPSATADNIPILATAGEWMQPVASVQYYGAQVMEALRQRLIPRELFTNLRLPSYRPAMSYALASGGAVPASASGSGGGITMINVTDPRDIDRYLASADGHNAILNVLSSRAPAVKRILK
jgi:hypothetical protein